MTNLSKKSEIYKLINVHTNNCILTINEIKNYCKQLNNNLYDVIDRLDIIFAGEFFTEYDRKYIQKRDIRFKEFRLSKEDELKHGEIIISSILEASLFEAIERAIKFFGAPDKDEWHNKIMKYKTDIIRIDQDTDWMLDTLNTLFQTFHYIFSGLGSTKLSEIMKNYNYIKSNDIDGVNFNFSFVSLAVSNESDIFKKKDILLEAITQRYMNCLQLNIDPDNYHPNVEFKTKCLKAIEIIDFQIQNTTNNTIVEVSNAKYEDSKNEKAEFESESQTQSKDFTTKRQVLAMYYLLNELDKNTNSIDRTVKARFIHFLTGKNESNIYKTLADPLKGLENKTNKKSIFKDLEFIKEHFDNLGLHSISQKITNDMQEA